MYLRRHEEFTYIYLAIGTTLYYFLRSKSTTGNTLSLSAVLTRKHRIQAALAEIMSTGHGNWLIENFPTSIATELCRSNTMNPMRFYPLTLAFRERGTSSWKTTSNRKVQVPWPGTIDFSNQCMDSSEKLDLLSTSIIDYRDRKNGKLTKLSPLSNRCWTLSCFRFCVASLGPPPEVFLLAGGSRDHPHPTPSFIGIQLLHKAHAKHNQVDKSKFIYGVQASITKLI